MTETRSSAVGLVLRECNCRARFDLFISKVWSHLYVGFAWLYNSLVNKLIVRK